MTVAASHQSKSHQIAKVIDRCRAVHKKCTLCSDCSDIFVSFQTVVVCFCDRVSSTSPLFSFLF